MIESLREPLASTTDRVYELADAVNAGEMASKPRQFGSTGWLLPSGARQFQTNERLLQSTDLN
jgi:hypothetical protein